MCILAILALCLCVSVESSGMATGGDGGCGGRLDEVREELG
jgi:hypothetical protein